MQTLVWKLKGSTICLYFFLSNLDPLEDKMDSKKSIEKKSKFRAKQQKEQQQNVSAVVKLSNLQK